jgi:molecular chaperone DnaJ
MATTERDYYELLAVSRTASADEIKRAFRRLAREGIRTGRTEPDADHRFREIVEAYEVLSNSERRELYDRFGHAGLRSGGFQPTAFDLGNLSDLFSAFFGDDIFGAGGRSGGRGRGADIAARVEIDLAEVATGPIVRCRSASPFLHALRGNGAEPDTPIRSCPTCGGGGRVRQVSRSVFGEFVRAGTCPTCSGSGQLIEKQCEQCKRRRPRDRGAHPRGRDTARHPRRAAHQTDRRGSFGNPRRSSR